MNLASRLESHTKVAQRSILVDRRTCDALGERIPFEPLGPVQVKGRSASVDVFAIRTSDARA